MPVRVGDVMAVLDDLGIERSHFIGISWGGRLCFGIAEHAPERIRSLVTIGQQPYAIDPDGPLASVVSEALAASREQGIGALVEAFEAIAGRYPDAVRETYLACDAAAMRAAWRSAMDEGAVSEDLGSWDVRCLICVGEDDRDFFDQARAGGGGDPQRGVPSDRRHRPSGCGHGCDRSRAPRGPSHPARDELTRARGGIRTPTPFRAPAPKAGASAGFRHSRANQG